MITKATLEDVSSLNQLINSAYRGESSKKGWTTEANLLEGKRTTEDELNEIITRGLYIKEKYILLSAKTPSVNNIFKLHMKDYKSMYNEKDDDIEINKYHIDTDYTLEDISQLFNPKVAGSPSDHCGALCAGAAS